MPNPRQLVVGSFVLLLGASLMPAVAQAGQVDPTSIETVREELAFLKKQLGTRRADNEELIEYLNAAAKAYPTLTGEGSEKLQAEIRAALLKGTSVWKLHKEHNARLPVNLRAAELLGEIAPKLESRARQRLAGTVEKHLKQLDNARYEVEAEQIESLANLLARIGEERSIKFLMHEFMRTEDRSLPYMVAMLKAVPLFERVSASGRHELVKRAIRLYAPLETAAETSTTDPVVISKGRTWDQIRTHVIKMMQAMARTPLDKQQQALNTVHQFQTWFRRHENPRRAPWVLPKAKAAAPAR